MRIHNLLAASQGVDKNWNVEYLNLDVYDIGKTIWSTDKVSTPDYDPFYTSNVSSISITSNNRVYSIDSSNSTIVVTGHRFSSTINNVSVGEDSNIQGIFVSDNTHKLYIVGDATNTIYEYNINGQNSNLTSGISLANSKSVALQDSSPRDLRLSSDGTKAFLVGNATGYIYEYSLSAPWDIGTASFVQRSATATQESDPTGIAVRGDGTHLYLVGDSSNTVHYYTLGSGWDISTKTYQNSYTIPGTEYSLSTIDFFPNSSIYAVMDNVSQNVNHYAISALLVNHEISVNMYTVGGLFLGGSANTSITTLTADRNDRTSFRQTHLTTPFNIRDSYLALGTRTGFNFTLPDITGMTGRSGTSNIFVSFGDSTIRQYDNVPSGTPIYSLDTSSLSVPTTLTAKTDGTRLYFAGTDSNLYELELSSAWDLTSASYVGTNKTLNARASMLMFKSDGSTLITNDKQYRLTTAWDITTLTLTGSYDIQSIGNANLIVDGSTFSAGFIPESGDKLIFTSNGISGLNSENGASKTVALYQAEFGV